MDKMKQRIMYSHAREHDAGISLLDYMARTFSRLDSESWRREIEAGAIKVNEQPGECRMLLKQHDCIAYYPGERSEPEAAADYTIVHEDKHILVVDKPANLCVHPSGPFYRNTLWHMLGLKYGEVHFVNRLDKETSGLMVVALDKRTAAMMDNRCCPMCKEYLALVYGNFHGTIRARGHLEADTCSAIPKKKRFVREDVMPVSPESADTELKEERPIGADMTLVRAMPHTGRQHQIRATLFSLGFPMVGDKLYGPDELLYLKVPNQSFTKEDMAALRMGRQALHSAKLTFQHPWNYEVIRCEAPLPKDFITE